MEPLVVIHIIKDVIEKKVKNLNPDIENQLINELLNSGIKSKKKILQYIREKLELPSIGSDKKIYWIKRGWSEEEANKKRIIKKMPSSPMKIENWLNKINDKTGQKYTEEEAIYKIRTFRKCNKEYWIEKGYTEQEANQMIFEFQKENSNKFLKKALENPEKYAGRTETQLLYWLNKGYDFEEAKQKLKNRQNTTSLSKYIEKFGEEIGLIKYRLRLDKISYFSSRNFYVDKYGEKKGDELFNDIISRRIIKFNKSSKEAFSFFKDIYKSLRRNGIQMEEIYWGVGSSNEWFIREENCIFFYDFLIHPLKIIIEYHGTSFHPKEGQTDWKSIYGVTYEKQIKIDRMKKEVAESNGFEYLYVYSDEDLKTKQMKFIEYINSKLK